MGGGPVGDIGDLFITKSPPRFQKLQQFGDNLRLEDISRGFLSRGFLQPQIILLYPFRNQFAELVNADRIEVQQFFAARGWDAFLVFNPCILAFSIRNETAITVVLSWGKNRGVVFTGPLTSDIEKGIAFMITNLHLLEGACAWN